MIGSYKHQQWSHLATIQKYIVSLLLSNGTTRYFLKIFTSRASIVAVVQTTNQLPQWHCQNVK